MGVALDVHVSQARWQQLKNMNADAEGLDRDICNGDEDHEEKVPRQQGQDINRPLSLYGQ